jgi:hypothetical protein
VQNRNIVIDNGYLKMWQFEYCGMLLTYQNLIQKERKSGLNFGNPCYHLAENLSSSCLLSKHINENIENCNFAFGFI